MRIDMDYKIKLIDDLIKENPEATIKDYLDVLSEIKQITPYDQDTTI